MNMKLQPKKESINIEEIFEKKQAPIGFWSNLMPKEKQESILSEEDKKVAFLLENNLLVNVAKLEQSGYVLNEEQKSDYNMRLYNNILMNSDNVIRDYLLNEVEITHKFLAIALLVEMQGKKSKNWLNISKTVTSFFDKVKKGLDNDPVAKYKFKKLNEEEFINELFDIWQELGQKHINDIKNNVINKKRFWFFNISKSEKEVQNDLNTFIEIKMQKHIYSAEDYFSIPFKNNIFTQYIPMEKMLKSKNLMKEQEDIHNKISRLDNCYKLNILNTEEINKLVYLIESKVREHYQEDHMAIIEDIQNKEQNSSNNLSENEYSNVLNDKTIKNLPNEAIKIINEVKNISSELFHKDINNETKEIINFLLQEKMTEVINKYVSIDSNYRNNLKNVQGKNATELMLESLNVIKESIKHIEKDINEENLKNLSIHTRYLKDSFKNK